MVLVKSGTRRFQISVMSIFEELMKTAKISNKNKTLSIPTKQVNNRYLDVFTLFRMVYCKIVPAAF